MLASNPASMVNQNPTDLGIQNRFNLSPSRSRAKRQKVLGVIVAALGDLDHVMDVESENLAARRNGASISSFRENLDCGRLRNSFSGREVHPAELPAFAR